MLKGKMSQLAIMALGLMFGNAAAQTFVPTGNPAEDKVTWLGQRTPQILVNGNCIDPITHQPHNSGIAQVGGTLWPTLLQAVDFLTPSAVPAPLCITAGTDGHPPAPSGRGHVEGFKIDLRILNQSNTFQDDLSQFIMQAATPDGCRGDVSRPATSSNDHAPLWIATAPPSSLGMVFAMEHPIPQSSNPCANPYTGVTPHWDLQSSYGGITVTPTALTVSVGNYKPVLPAAIANGVSIPDTQPWMFDYNFPSDPNETIATVDRTGNITGTAGNVIGLNCNAPSCSTLLMVSEGQFFRTVNVNVNPSTCAASNSVPSGPFGVCSSVLPTSVPCWQFNPAPSNGNCKWSLMPPSTFTFMGNSPILSPVQSLDPNEISGPAGSGTAMYISGGSPSQYGIFFGNDPKASAATDQVVVTTQIDPTRFDLSTVTLGPITFPNYPGVAPPALPLKSVGQFSTQVSLTSPELLVNVTASLNSAIGLVTWTLQAIDPNTGQPPADPSLGILAPGGNGSVSFTANLLPSLTDGSVISDQGNVIFDTNPPISTSVWSNTLDNIPPTSHVGTLPTTEWTSVFMVSWSGTDAQSGVQYYTLYVSDSGGPYLAWLTQTTSTSAKFIGTVGHSYAFYSVATDNVGNVEDAKAAPDASTTINADTTPPIVTPTITGTQGQNGWYVSGVTVSWSVTDAESGVASSNGCSATNLTANTAGTKFTCSAKNGAGLSSSNSVIIKIDQTSPMISGLPKSGCNLWPPDHRLVHVATVSSKDALSGLALFNVSATSNEPNDSNDRDDIEIKGKGLEPREVYLRAIELHHHDHDHDRDDRHHEGDPKIYTLTAIASDLAGNTTMTTSTCTVRSRRDR